MKQPVTLEEYQALQKKYDQVKFELDQLKKMIFGSKKERFVPTPVNQPTLFDDPVDTKAPPAEEEIKYKRKKPGKKHPGRASLPDNLPTEDIVIEPDEDTADMVQIGEEIIETLDYKPGVLLKRRYIRKKYARKKESESQANVVIGPTPDRPIEKAVAEAGLLAHLIVCKFIDHTPFYRQIQRFKRDHNWSVSASTINDWFVAVCTLIEPLYKQLVQHTFDTDYLQADESPIKVQDKKKKGTSHQGYMWVYRNPVNGLVVFDYHKGRGRDGPAERLANYQGLLQCDGYKVYDNIAKASQGTMALVSCLAHQRRKFYKAKDNHPEIANEGLKMIQQLYALERQFRQQSLDASAITQQRQELSKPIYEALRNWVLAHRNQYPPKSAIGKALNYTARQLPKLEHYLSDGRVEIDNNKIENVIRPLALGRKNYLFAGSHAGAQRIAMIYSFFATCKTLDVNPWEWLKDVLKQLPNHHINQIHELLPHNCMENAKT